MSCQHTYSMMMFLPAMLVWAGPAGFGLPESDESEDFLPGAVIFSVHDHTGARYIFTIPPGGLKTVLLRRRPITNVRPGTSGFPSPSLPDSVPAFPDVSTQDPIHLIDFYTIIRDSTSTLTAIKK